MPGWGIGGGVSIFNAQPSFAARGSAGGLNASARNLDEGRHLWLSARALILNSGPEDLWLSATGAVLNGG